MSTAAELEDEGDGMPTVEEARELVVNEVINYATARIGVGAAFFQDALDDLIEAVRRDEREQYRELLEAAIEYRDVQKVFAMPPSYRTKDELWADEVIEFHAFRRLRAAAVALDDEPADMSE